jgi:hypothetical protein
MTADTESNATPILHYVWYKRVFGSTVNHTSQLVCELTAERDIVIRAHLEEAGLARLLTGARGWVERYRGTSPQAAYDTLCRDAVQVNATMDRCETITAVAPRNLAAFAELVEAALHAQTVAADVEHRLLAGNREPS